MKYYYLLTYLPEIQRDDKKLKVRLPDLLDEQYYIAPGDWREVELVLLQRDMILLEKLLSGKDADIEHTVYDREYWKEQVKAPKEAPPFLEEFLPAVVSDGFGPQEADALYNLYFDHVIENTANPLLREYVAFERMLRNVLAAVRARKLGLPASDHLVGAGELEEQLGRSTSEDFGLGQDLPWIERLLEARDPMQREEEIEQILWDHLDERTTGIYFDFDLVLAYLLKLQLLEKRLALSEEQGMKIVRDLEEL